MCKIVPSGWFFTAPPLFCWTPLVISMENSTAWGLKLSMGRDQVGGQNWEVENDCFTVRKIPYRILSSSVVVQAPPLNRCAALNADLPLVTSFGAFSVKEVKWKFTCTSSKTELVIADYENGKETYRRNNKYKPRDNGTKLVKENLTINDIGIYTAEATLLDDELKIETFNVTICGDPENEDLSTPVPNTLLHLFWIVPIIIVLVGYVVWKCLKKSSHSSGQGDQNNVGGNFPVQESRDQNNEVFVKVSIQETQSQKSPFINVSRGKSEEYKDHEDEGSKVKDEPSFDHNSVY